MAKRLCEPTSGKIGLQVYQGGRNGQIVRALAIPTNPKSSAQRSSRARLTTNSKAWDLLTEAQRNAWRAAAALLMSRSRLGMSGALTGNQLYVKVNNNLTIIGETAVSDPPEVPTIPPIPVQSLVITNTAGVIVIKLGASDAPGDGTMLRAAGPVLQGVNRAPGMAYLGLLESPVGGYITITTAYTARFGVPPVGKKVFVSVNSNVSGFEDEPLVFSATVPTAT